MTGIGALLASATATAVFPTPVGPTMTGVRCRVSGAAEASLKLFLGKLNHGRPAVHIVRGQRGVQEPHDELPHLAHIERLPRLDRGATRVRRREALETILPAAEPPACEIGDELLETPRGFEPRMRVRRGVHDDAATGERLDLIADPGEQLPMRFDGVEVRRRAVPPGRQQEAAGRWAGAPSPESWRITSSYSTRSCAECWSTIATAWSVGNAM